MTVFYLVRHGETDWNRQRRIQGSTDIPLNDTGRGQAARTGRLLARRSWDGIVSSPLSRALETAVIVADAVGIEESDIEIVDALVERQYGAAEGLDDSELLRLYPGDTLVPGRESRDEVADRVLPALVSLADRHPTSSLIIATHGGVIRAVLNAVAPESQHHRGIPITNGSVHSFRSVAGSLQLVAFNDPIDLASVSVDDGDLVDQNAVEERELRS
jgi:probable phosphoglycerate mutase